MTTQTPKNPKKSVNTKKITFDGEHSESINYNYTHHISEDKFDFSKDFPQRDKLNKALKLHLDNIKKYGKK